MYRKIWIKIAYMIITAAPMFWGVACATKENKFTETDILNEPAGSAKVDRVSIDIKEKSLSELIGRNDDNGEAPSVENIYQNPRMPNVRSELVASQKKESAMALPERSCEDIISDFIGILNKQGDNTIRRPLPFGTFIITERASDRFLMISAEGMLGNNIPQKEDMERFLCTEEGSYFEGLFNIEG